MVVEWPVSIWERIINQDFLVTLNIVQKQFQVVKIIKHENKMLGKPDEELSIHWISKISKRTRRGRCMLKNSKGNHGGRIYKFDDIKVTNSFGQNKVAQMGKHIIFSANKARTSNRVS